MRIVLAVLCLFALYASIAQAQEQDTTGFSVGPSRSWSPGEPSPIRALVRYFVSRPDSEFTEEAVQEAVAAAMFHSGLPPDVEVSMFTPTSGQSYLRIEAQRYERFAVRFEFAYVEPVDEDTTRELCHSESKSGHANALSALLMLTHDVRDLIACVGERIELRWPDGST